jgi:hypothetical protein
MEINGFAQLSAKQRIDFIATYEFVDSPFGGIAPNSAFIPGVIDGRFSKRFGSNAAGQGQTVASLCGGGLLKVFYQAKAIRMETQPLAWFPVEANDESWVFLNSVGFQEC